MISIPEYPEIRRAEQTHATSFGPINEIDNYKNNQ